MAVIAVVGWYARRSARVPPGRGRSLSPTPPRATRSAPFPSRSSGSTPASRSSSIALTVAPIDHRLLPGNAGDDGGGDADHRPRHPILRPELVASERALVRPTGVVVPADTPIKLTFDNQQAGVPHNVHILTGAGRRCSPGEDVTGPGDDRLRRPAALAAGQYHFLCTIHPPMTGTLIAQ